MRSGELKHYVEFQTRAITQTAYLDQDTTWTTTFEDWIKIEPLSSRDLIAAQAINAAVTHKVTMRFRAGITVAMRILYGSRIFDIRTPPRNTREQSRMMEFECEEGLTSG